ncbi:MAG: glycosyltransferase family 4 protein [Prevotella sp.]|nr:glycosyltransferase family 4 protein [Prevotella sp.]
MVLGFDAKRIVRNATGLGSYSRTLINSLSAADADTQFLLYAPDEGRDDLRNQIIQRPNVAFSYYTSPTGGGQVGALHPSSLIPKSLKKAFWRSRGIVNDLQRDGVQLFHGLSGELPVGLRRAGIPGIVTIHDLIFLRHPEYYNPIDVFFYRRKFHATLREAERVVAISECTKRDILAYSDFPEDRIDVVYQSCGTRFREEADAETKAEVRKRYNLPEHYILSVGTIEPRKNVLLAGKALKTLTSYLLPLTSEKDLHLVLVGRQTSYVRKEILPYAERNGLTDRVHLLSDVPNHHLPAIYQQALCFVYPSRYEGFGIPIIEAIQSRLPVVAATGSCLEEAGGPDCLYVHPDDAEGLAEAITRSLPGAEGREERIQRSLEYIQRFENNDIAQQMLTEYERCLHRS